MSIDDILDPIHCCGHIGTHNMEVEEDRQIVKQALYKDMVAILGEDEADEFPDIHKIAPRIRNQLRQELRTKLKEYFGVKE